MPGLAPATELFENDEMHQKEGVLGRSPEGRNEDKPFSASMVTKKWIVFLWKHDAFLNSAGTKQHKHK